MFPVDNRDSFIGSTAAEHEEKMSTLALFPALDKAWILVLEDMEHRAKLKGDGQTAYPFRSFVDLEVLLD